jgi:hypothetical protein
LVLRVGVVACLGLLAGCCCCVLLLPLWWPGFWGLRCCLCWFPVPLFAVFVGVFCYFGFFAFFAALYFPSF